MISKRIRQVRGSVPLPPPLNSSTQPIATQLRTLQMAQNEGRILLALQAYQAGQIPSLRAAARAYDVPYTTLSRRSKGTLSQSESVSPNLKLTQTEESTLIQWILSMDTRGIPATKALVHQMAELLLLERVPNASALKPQIGKR